MNIVDLISSQLSSEVLGKLGSLAGTSREEAESASTAAVPALLQIFGKLASSGTGAEQLAKSMGGLDLSRLGDLVGYLGGSQGSSLGKLGGDLLGTLLGSGNLGRIISAIASYVGSQPDLMKKIVGYLAPIVLGAIAKQLGGRPDAAGVSRFFSEQENNIAAAMPAGLSLGDLGSLLPSGSSAAPGRPSPAAATSGMPGWLLPLLAIAAIAAAALLFRGREAPRDDVGDEAVAVVAETRDGPITDRVTEVVEATEDGIVGTVTEVITIDPKFVEAARLGRSATELFSRLATVFAGVTDATTAEAALPKLEGFSSSLEQLAGEAGGLPAAERAPFAGFIRENLGVLRKVIDTAMAIPGVREILGKVVTPMLETLGSLAEGPSSRN